MKKPGLSVDQAIDSAVMVKQHHSMLAFFFPFIFMIVKRLWIVLFAYLIISSFVVMLESMLPIWAGMLITLMLSLWISVEAPNLIGWTLQRNGYVEVGSLFAENSDHCERRYVEARCKDNRLGGLISPGRPHGLAHRSDAESSCNGRIWPRSCGRAGYRSVSDAQYP